MHRSISGLLLLAILFLSPTLSSAQVNFAQSVSFGDSLTDNEFLFLLFGNDPVLYGRDPFEVMFDQGAGEYDQLDNYAVLGSTSEFVLEQVKLYRDQVNDGLREPATLVSLEMGGNDVLNQLGLLASYPPGANEDADAVVDYIKANIRKSLRELRCKGEARPQVVLWTVPDVTSIPQVQGLQLPEPALANLRAHVEKVNRFIRAVSRRRNVALLDLFEINQTLANDPPTVMGFTLIPPPIFGFQEALFADPIHPTAVGNGIIANEMIEQCNDEFDDEIPYLSEYELAILAGIE